MRLNHSQRGKAEVISFKADPDLVEAMKGVPNRSEFIRAAILTALDNACPLCGGTGILTPRQTEHWRQFARTHVLQECDTCHELHLLCEHETAADAVR
ncbi:MAG: ribbon-helix-helix domain-containing protein [Planctomycetota bacterium]